MRILSRSAESRARGMIWFSIQDPKVFLRAIASSYCASVISFPSFLLTDQLHPDTISGMRGARRQETHHLYLIYGSANADLPYLARYAFRKGAQLRLQSYNWMCAVVFSWSAGHSKVIHGEAPTFIRNSSRVPFPAATLSSMN